MACVNPTCFHMSASSIGAFKACPTRWRLLYREGLRPAEDTESQRVGTNWHALHEVYAGALNNCEHPGGNAPLDVGQFALSAVIEHLNQRYAQCPQSKTVAEWGLERQILLTCFVGYLWYWQNDAIEFLASELAFDLPIHVPRLGLPLPLTEALRVGKIDHVIRWQGMVGAMERKSTTRSIAPDSDYWDKGKKDTQVSMYALAFQDMMQAGTLPKEIAVTSALTGSRIGNTLYDVWHRPTIKPAMLTQKETAEFITTGTYCDHQFAVQRGSNQTITEGSVIDTPTVAVDGEAAEVEVGKKGFAIRETVGMYAARLLQDIYTRPEFYFQRREIVRTDMELRKFRADLYNIYQSQKSMAKTGHFYENEQQCRATFPCSMIPVCYGPGADAVCDGTTTPNGFKRIFVDLKVNGETIDAE